MEIEQQYCPDAIADVVSLSGGLQTEAVTFCHFVTSHYTVGSHRPRASAKGEYTPNGRPSPSVTS